MTKQAVAVILKSPQGHYALQLRDDKPGINSPGKWGLFGGEIEEGELPLSAVIREIREELGVELNPDRVGFLDTFDDGENGGIRVHTFRYSYADTPPSFDVAEGERMEWFTPHVIINHLGDTIVAAHMRAIKYDFILNVQDGAKEGVK